MRRLCALLLPALAACATHLTPGQLAARASIEPTPNLCAITLLSPPDDVLKAAQDEIAGRHATCDWEQARAIAQLQIQQRQAQAEEQQARQANAMALMGASAQLLQQSGPHYYAPPPTQTTCVQQGVFLNCNSQ